MLVCGEPGVGKSYVTDKLKLLFQANGMAQHEEYEFVSLQAVVAAQSSGDTIHHFGRVGRGNNSLDVNQKTKAKQSQRLSKIRWLIIDEVGMVDAPLLQQFERNIKAYVQEADTYKLDEYGVERPWAGWNVIASKPKMHRHGKTRSV